jgi:hypothetical protein
MMPWPRWETWSATCCPIGSQPGERLSPAIVQELLAQLLVAYFWLFLSNTGFYALSFSSPA